ncbi:MAG: HAD family hydrolase [Oscillospiraceae bacterium]|nr:HAD family hydrolase [Oscillospiraceae bacterium]
MYRLVIFDLDGTLADTLSDLAYSGNTALEHFGYPTHDTEEYRYFVGDGIPMLIRRILPENQRSEENISKVKAEFDRVYAEHFDVFTKPYEGISELLERLSERGVMTAIASNKAAEFTERVVSKLFTHRFSAVCGKKRGRSQKPAPDIVFGIMSQLGVNPDEVLYAGDSGVDMQTAANAGVKSVGCLWGFCAEKELSENGAWQLAANAEELGRIIGIY